MGTSVHPWRTHALVLAFLLPSLSCKGFLSVFTPQPQQQRPPSAALDTPPPLHTGGLGVLSVGPSGQGPGPSPGSHGDPLAGGIATGIGLAVAGATVAKTVSACAQPDASPACLRGPGPADSVSDAGAP
jgi:hypothetical protein